MNIKKTLAASLLALSIGNAFAAESTGVEHNTQAFLDALAAGTDDRPAARTARAPRRRPMPAAASPSARRASSGGSDPSRRCPSGDGDRSRRRS